MQKTKQKPKKKRDPVAAITLDSTVLAKALEKKPRYMRDYDFIRAVLSLYALDPELSAKVLKAFTSGAKRGIYNCDKVLNYDDFTVYNALMEIARDATDLCGTGVVSIFQVANYILERFAKSSSPLDLNDETLIFQ